jgi:hypothetical protein
MEHSSLPTFLPAASPLVAVSKYGSDSFRAASRRSITLRRMYSLGVVHLRCATILEECVSDHGHEA